MSEKRISQLYIAGGLVNVLGILLFSKFFSNTYLVLLDVSVFSKQGLLVIMLWGAAYIAIAEKVKEVPWISLVFAVEKLFYFVNWSLWMSLHMQRLSEIYSKDILTGIFFTIYGPNDLLFGLLFFFMFLKYRK